MSSALTASDLRELADKLDGRGKEAARHATQPLRQLDRRQTVLHGRAGHEPARYALRTRTGHVRLGVCETHLVCQVAVHVKKITSPHGCADNAEPGARARPCARAYATRTTRTRPCLEPRRALRREA